MNCHVEVNAIAENRPIIGSDSEDEICTMARSAPGVVLDDTSVRDGLLELEVPVPQPSRMTFFGALKSILLEKKVVATADGVFTIATIVLLATSIIVDPWRHFLVDRAALVRLWRAGKLEGDILNSTIAFSRAQGIQRECFIDVPENATVLESRRGCHSVLYECSGEKKNKTHLTIFSIIVLQMSFSPIIFFLSIAALIFLVSSAFLKKPLKKFALRFTAGIRALNTIFCLIFLVLAVGIAHLFERKNPSFPFHWHRQIRAHTEVAAFESGIIEWTLATLFQILAMALDLHCSQWKIC